MTDIINATHRSDVSHWLLGSRRLRRLKLVVHWTLTNQLHQQFRYWIQAHIRDRKLTSIKAPPLLGVPYPRELYIPRATKPIVSIIVPTYGKPDITLGCLASIAKYSSATGIEVIVVDDAPPGQTARVLCLVEGIKLIINEENMGFIRSCNLGAQVALGEFILFLNNDTQVTDGWLEPMLRLFRDFRCVGAVGSKLLFPDGYLQEAGCIIWRNGAGWNLGRRKNPADHAFSYVREVDYCSGASLMIPKILFDRVGGFDERYAPAYFEDVDLSLKLRAIGYRTLYQPRSVVVHIEGMSHGTDDEGPKSHYIARNRPIFVDCWRSVLRREQFADGQNLFRARDRALRRRVILIVDHFVPQPDRDAGSRTILNLLQAFLAHGLVVKFLPHDLCGTPGYTQALEDLGIEVICTPGTKSIDDWMSEFGAELDAVVLSRPHVAEALLPLLHRLNVGPIIYYGHDIHFQRIAGEAMIRSSPQLEHEGSLMQARERSLWRNVDIVLYPTDDEAQTVRQLEPKVVCYTINAYAFGTFPTPRSPPKNTKILFVAGFAHPPNEDAAVWFVQEVLPLVRRSVPTVALTIIGSNPSDLVTALVGDDVTLLSNVSDAELAGNYKSARVAVVPLRFGAGMKLKTVEALREGLPLVTTPVGAQGLPALVEVASVCADKSVFAQEVCRLLVDDSLWLERCAGQIKYANARFTNRALQETVSSVLMAANVL